MNISNIGIIFNYLAEHKVIRGYEKKGIKRSAIEKELAQILDNHIHRLDDLEEFLSTQGMGLKILNAQEMGIANQGRIYLMIRQLGESDTPSHLRTKQLWEMFKDKSRKKDTLQTTVIWTSYLYLQLLHFLYTLDNRAIESISTYSETWVDYDIFKEDIIKSIDTLRQSNTNTSYAESKIQKCLTSSKDTEISVRVERFFNTLQRVGVLEKIDDPNLRMDRKDSPQTIYKQTLWSAVDVSENFNRYATLLITTPSEVEVYELSKVNH